MKNKKLQFLAVASVFVAALGGCEILAGIGETDLANDGNDSAAPVTDSSIEADAPVVDIDAGPPPQPIGGHDQTCAYGGASSYMSVSCNPGQVITGVTSALFGRFDGSCADHFSSDGGGVCPPIDSSAIDAGVGERHFSTVEAMEELCVGLRSCTFVANNLPPVIKDPCSGVAKEFAIQITCGTIADAGADAGDIATDIALDLNAADLSVGYGNAVTSWKSEAGNETATTASGKTNPTLNQTTTNGADAMKMVRFGTGAALSLPPSNSGDGYLKGFGSGSTVFTVVSLHGEPQPGAHIFDFGTTGVTGLSIGEADSLGAAFSSVGATISDPHTLNGPGAWTFDYPQVISAVAAPLPSGVIPAGDPQGLTWGKTVIYQGTVPTAVGFAPLPGTADRTSNLLGQTNGAGPDWIGDLGELVVYSRALTPAEMAIKQNALISTWHLCDGADFTSDPANCGGCGNICTAGATCDHGICTDVDLSAWVVTNPSSGDAGILFGPRDGDSGVANVSWAQARNTCIVENSDLVQPLISDQNALIGGYFGEVSSTKNRAIGVIRENSVPISASTRTTAPYDDFSGAPAFGCAEMETSEAWNAVGCNASSATTWGCQQPTTTYPTSCPIFADIPRNHAYAFCAGPFPNEPARRVACTNLASSTGELVVRDFTEASNVASLGVGTPLSINLTNVRKSPAWTLADGTTAPFIGWNASFNVATSIPPFIVGPACAVLNPDGTMTDESCFASNAVVCSMPDGTPADSTNPTIVTSFPGFIDIGNVGMGDTARAAGGNGTRVLTGVFPGDVITGVLEFAESDGRPFTLKIGLYPSNQTTCMEENPDPYPPVVFTFSAPLLEGIYPLEAYHDSDCSPGWDDRTTHAPFIFGSVQVVAPK